MLVLYILTWCVTSRPSTKFYEKVMADFNPRNHQERRAVLPTSRHPALIQMTKGSIWRGIC
jgi:hypothetical protein